jgi:hypothetical protein
MSLTRHQISIPCRCAIDGIRISIFVGLMYIALRKLQNVTDIIRGAHTGTAKLQTMHLPNRQITHPN